jgi:hypothetical protein
MKPSLTHRVVAEFVGTLFLLTAVVGSGIMGERLAAGNPAIALLANSGIGCNHPRPRFYFRGTPQSCSDTCRRMAGPYRMAGYTGIYRRSGNWSIRRSRSRSPHVRHVAILFLDTCPHWPCTTFERVHRHVRTALGGLGLRPTSALCRPLRGGSLYHRSILVHVFNFLRQSRRHPCAITERHVRRYQARRRYRVCRRPVGRSVRGNTALPTANPVT